MFAVVEIKGKQYRVEEGGFIRTERFDMKEGGKVVIDKVMLIKDDGKTITGNPYIKGASCECEVVRHGRGKKIVVFKFKAKKNYRRKIGHRQDFTILKVVRLNIPGS